MIIQYEENFMDTIRKRRNIDLLFLCFLAVLALGLLWRCRYGFASNDEAFYLTIPYRLLQGDTLLTEEWHLSQLSGLLLTPAVWIFTTLTGGTEGMLLFMRYLCVITQTAAALFLYNRLKAFSRLGAAAASLSFVLFIPLSICALSYNSMGILFLTLSQVILITGKSYLPAGLCFAAAVLCCPYLLLVYAAYLLIVLGTLVWSKLRKAAVHPALSVAGALWFTAGAAIAALFFLLFVLSRSTVSDILPCLELMMNDPEHLTYSMIFKLREYWNCILYATNQTPRLYACLAAAALVCLLDWKRQSHRAFHSCIIGGIIFALMFSHYQGSHSLNYIMWPVNLWAPFLLLLLSDRKSAYPIFTLLWLPGIAYSFCMNLASNNIFYAISSGASVATVATLVMIGMYLRELRQSEAAVWQKILPIGILCLTLAYQITTESCLRYQNIYWGTALNTQTEQISEGVQKGLYVTPEYKEGYTWDLEMLKTVDSFHGEQVLYLTETTWYYLQGQGKNAAYSAWLSGVSQYTLDQLEAYYAINPQKLPDVVYTMDTDIAAKFCELFGYRIADETYGLILLPL